MSAVIPRAAVASLFVAALVAALLPLGGSADAVPSHDHAAAHGVGAPLSAALLADLAADGESHPNQLTALGDGRAVFSAEGDASNGERELYVTDGTPAGTQLLANLRSGFGSFPSDFTLLEPGVLLFTARSDAADGERELHRTDGTPEGTTLVVDLRTGDESDPLGITPLGDGRAVFAAQGDASNGERELYITDGTAEGTQLITNLHSGDDAFGIITTGRIAVLGDGRVVFAAEGDASDGERELYITDGTAAGTALLADLRDGGSSLPTHLHTMPDGRVLFTAQGDASDGHREIYVTDGTPGGTNLVADLRAGDRSVPFVNGPRFANLPDGRVVFAAEGDASDGEREVYVTDGTAGGTSLVANLRDGDDSIPEFGHFFTPLGDGRVVFPAEGDASDGERELYITDGSAEGTELIANLRTDGSSLGGNDRVAMLHEGQVLFTAATDETDEERELHVTDGSAEGTRAVARLREGRGSFPDRLAPLGDGRALFIASSDASQDERELHLAGPVPAAPVISVTAGDERLTVAWQDADEPTPVDSRTVRTTPEGGETIVEVVDGDEASVTVDGLANGVPHDVVVTATSFLGESAPSETHTATPQVDEPGDRVLRIGGANRFETAALLSAWDHPDGAEHVYIATGINFPDALAGGVLAAFDDAPLLLTAWGALPSETVAELGRLEPDRVTVLGGDAVIGAAVLEELGSYADDVERLSGPTRFHTAAAVSQAAFPDGADVAFLATGDDFPDALAAVPAAVGADAPLLLATRDWLPAATAEELARLAPQQVVLLGGSGALGPDVAEEVADLGPAVERLEGPTRFDTAAAIAAASAGDGADEVFLATGLAFPDALAAGPAAGRSSAPILLGRASALTEPTEAAIAELAPDSAVLLGGTGALGASVEAALTALLE